MQDRGDEYSPIGRLGNMVTKLQERGNQAQLFEECVQKLSQICVYQNNLVQNQLDYSRGRVAEELYVRSITSYNGAMDAATIPTASPYFGFDIPHQCLNTFEIQTILISSNSAAGASRKSYLLLGNRVISIGLTMQLQGICILPNLRIPLQQTDRRTFIAFNSGDDYFVGLYGVQQGDAYHVG